MSDTDDIRRTVAGVTHFIDAKDWARLRALYGAEVTTDYTSLFGGTPITQSGDALIAGWQEALAAVATHHILGPIDVEAGGERASAECHVRGMHSAKAAKSGSTWEVLGHYVFTLARQAGGWRIVGMVLQTHMQIGNAKLLEEAAGA